jgi:twitching motility protein PilI
VDTLLGLRGADAFVSTAPSDPDCPHYFGNRFVDAVGTNWQEINLRTLSQTPQFLSISA